MADDLERFTDAQLEARSFDSRLSRERRDAARDELRRRRGQAPGPASADETPAAGRGPFREPAGQPNVEDVDQDDEDDDEDDEDDDEDDDTEEDAADEGEPEEPLYAAARRAAVRRRAKAREAIKQPSRSITPLRVGQLIVLSLVSLGATVRLYRSCEDRRAAERADETLELLVGTERLRARMEQARRAEARLGARGRWLEPWTLSFARADHSVTPLLDGRLLVVGGKGLDDATSDRTTEIVAVDGDTAGPVLEAPRWAHTATRLDDGRVLVAGGCASPTTAIVFDARGEGWSAAAALPSPRCRHAAVALADGRVLVVGGMRSEAQDAPALDTAAAWDPVQDAWTELPPMHRARRGHTATRLDDGRVVVIGGQAVMGGPPIRTTEIFDPTTSTWSDGPELIVPRRIHTATLLDDGGVLVAGGAGARTGDVETYPTFAERLLPDASAFQHAGEAGPRSNHAAVALGDGSVLIAGGVDARWRVVVEVAIFDPSTSSWNRGAPMDRVPVDPIAARMSDGTVALVGGVSLTDASHRPIERYVSE